MSLKDRIEADYREAFKSQEANAMIALRMLKAAVKNAEIAHHSDYEDDQVISVVNKEVKKIRESIAAYSKGNRADLVSQEEAQLAVLSKYLPEQLSDDELRDIVQDVIDRLGVKDQNDFGKTMKEVMAVTKGTADGKKVKELVQNLLSKN
ncbi:MAG: GatB/YqeY domain-containing protein [Patescibacteria group bacterium]